jgi:hypothetical protein
VVIGSCNGVPRANPLRPSPLNPVRGVGARKKAPNGCDSGVEVIKPDIPTKSVSPSVSACATEGFDDEIVDGRRIEFRNFTFPAVVAEYRFPCHPSVNFPAGGDNRGVIHDGLYELSVFVRGDNSIGGESRQCEGHGGRAGNHVRLGVLQKLKEVRA